MTPTGTFSNATSRLLRLLKSVSLIVAEDAKRTQHFLDSMAMALPPIVPDRSSGLPGVLETADVALLLDGWRLGPTGASRALIRTAIERGLPVIPVPGPALPITALVASGLPSATFVYAGKLPTEPAPCRSLLGAVAVEAHTLIFEATFGQISVLAPTLGERPLVVASSSERGIDMVRWPSLSAAQYSLTGHADQETCILIVGGAQEETAAWAEERLRAEVEARARQGFTAREIGPALATESGWPRREIYRLAVEAKRQFAREHRAPGR